MHCWSWIKAAKRTNWSYFQLRFIGAVHSQNEHKSLHLALVFYEQFHSYWLRASSACSSANDHFTFVYRVAGTNIFNAIGIQKYFHFETILDWSKIRRLVPIILFRKKINQLVWNKLSYRGTVAKIRPSVQRSPNWCSNIIDMIYECKKISVGCNSSLIRIGIFICLRVRKNNI